MKIVLLGHREIASNVALSLLVTAMPEHRYSVMLSGPTAAHRDTAPELDELARVEQEQCEQLASVGTGCGMLSLEEIAGRRAGIARVLDRPNSPEGLSLLAAEEPDLVISVRYRRILGSAALAIPRLGVLNLHSGLLPEYRGVMATFWAMLNEEPAIGSTLHYIVDATIDTGPVVGRAAMPVDRSRSYLANVLALYPSGCGMVVDAVDRIRRGEAIAALPQPAAGCYYSAPGREDILRFRAAGWRLFDGDEWRQFLQQYTKDPMAEASARPAAPRVAVDPVP